MLREHVSDLAHLIRLGQVSFTLEVDEGLDSFLHEDVMASPRSLLEPEAQEKGTKVIECQVGIRAAAENLCQDLLDLAHPTSRNSGGFYHGPSRRS